MDRLPVMSEHTAPDPRTPGPGRAWLWPVVALLVGLLIPAGLWLWFRFPAIGGADPGMWEVAALDGERGFLVEPLGGSGRASNIDLNLGALLFQFLLQC